MAKLSVHNLSGDVVGEREYSDVLFGAPSNISLVKQVFDVLFSRQFSGSAHTKTRSERRGSGRKPWKQKGTGNARTGSVRNPIWRKGGVIFGPRSLGPVMLKTVTSGMRRSAFLSALSEKVSSGDIVVFETLQFSQQKTRIFSDLLSKIVPEGDSVVVGLSSSEQDTFLMTRNLQSVFCQPARLLNVLHVLQYKKVFLSEESISELVSVYDKTESLSGVLDKK
ncbi:MAG: 50S ribosomal protein L4 [Candidatus Moranbacteria bacterium]|nr:50S ribosomal protein L4 [Candidatus Moranbacteria bacterium]